MTAISWDCCTAGELVELARQDAIVLLPVAATEQHGPHLPTGTDTLLCAEVCRRAAGIVRASRPIVVAPTLWPGLSEHHVQLGGTFSLSLATWHAVLRELCQSVLRAGFRRVLIVNGHGGNSAALNALTTDLARETGAEIATATYFSFLAAEAPAILEDQDSLQHACEAETSMIMAIRPELVAAEKLAQAHGPYVTQAQSPARPIHVWASFAKLAPSGVIGDARRASAAKGEALLEAAAGNLAARLVAGEPWG